MYDSTQIKVIGKASSSSSHRNRNRNWTEHTSNQWAMDCVLRILRHSVASVICHYNSCLHCLWMLHAFCVCFVCVQRSRATTQCVTMGLKPTRYVHAEKKEHSAKNHVHSTSLHWMSKKKLQPQIKIQLAIVAIVISRIETLPLLRMIRVYKFFNWLFVKFLGNPRQKVTGHRIQNTPSKRWVWQMRKVHTRTK